MQATALTGCHLSILRDVAMRHAGGHHARDHRAVLGAVKASWLCSDAAFRGASGLDRACAQRRSRQLRDGRARPLAASIRYTLSASCTGTWNMPKPVAVPPPGFDELSVEEQIAYVQSLWDRIAATPDQVPVPDWHREVLDERLKDFEANPDAGESWDIVRDRLRDNLRKR